MIFRRKVAKLCLVKAKLIVYVETSSVTFDISVLTDMFVLYNVDFN